MKNSGFPKLNLYVLFKDLFYNFFVILLAFLTGFIAVRTYFNYVYVPKYRSTMTVSVNVTDLNVSQNISKTIEIAGIFQNVFQSDVMKKIIRENVEDFEVASVSATVVEQTNLLTLSAEGANAIDAYKTLKAVYDNYTKVFADNIFDDVYINAVTYPFVPAAPYNPVSSGKYALIAGAALAFLCTVLICLFSALRDTVKQQSDIEKKIDAPFFGEVCHQHVTRDMRKRAEKEKRQISISILNPMVGYSFCESVNRIATKVEYLKNSRSAKTFIFSSVDEHEGKTTVSVNIALNLALKGHKTLLIDADLRRPSVFRFFSSEMFGSYSELGDYLLGKNEISDIIKHDSKSSLDIIGGKNSYQFAFELLSSERFKDMLRELYAEYDYIIIDTPPTSLTADAENIADSVDVTLIVVRQDNTPVSQINDTADILTNLDSYFAGCILNDYRDIYSSVHKGKTRETSGAYSSYYYR